MDNVPTSLQSSRAAEALGLLQFNKDQLINTVAVSSSQSLTEESILHEYKDMFNGLGRLPGYYHIEMDSDVKPVQNTRRPVPIPVRHGATRNFGEG